MQNSMKKMKKIGHSIIQSQIFLATFDEKIEIRERCKGAFQNGAKECIV